MTRLFFKSFLTVISIVFLLGILASCVPQADSGSVANSAYDPFPQTSVSPDSYTGSYPAYCGFLANSNRQECIGYNSSTGSSTNSTSNSSTTTGSSNNSTSTTYNSSYPSYCSQAQYSYRQDCGGNGIPPTSTSYPSYCSDSTYSYLVACGGNGTPTTANNAYPSYCSNSANSHLTACGGNGTPSSNVTSTTTYTPIRPSYCTNPQLSYRVECGGNGVQNTVTSSSSYPAYCTTAANSSRPECNATNSTTTSTTTTSNVPAYCSTPANSTRPECTGTATSSNPNINIVSNNNTTNTANLPAYCSTPANSTRPECSGSTTTTFNNTTTSSGVTVSGVWEGNLVNSENTLSVPTCMSLSDTNGQVTGQIYFRRSAGLEYYGELQGSTQATASASGTGTFSKNASLIVYYPDRTSTRFTGNFDSNNSFQSQYSYVDANGGTLTTGNSDLRRSSRSSCQ